MHKFSALLAISFAFSATAYAQVPGFPGGGQSQQTVIPGTSEDVSKGNSKISGVLIDSVSKQPVEFAVVGLWNPKTNQAIDGTTTDDKGKFEIKGIAAGKYQLRFSFIGYKSYERDIELGRRDNIDLGNVTLAPEIVQLQEVSVVGQAELIEERVDRLVFNAEKDVTSRGGDATDVMRKVPMLTVDLDGNVSLRGSSNVRVLINNKPSTIIASSVGDALRQIPADMIKTVEVITSPSARYDAEGTGGIINIITKKNTLQGLTLDINSGVGNRGANLGLNGSYRVGKMGFTLGGFGRANYNVKGEGESIQRSLAGAPNSFSIQQNTTSMNRGAFGRYTLGWDYDIDKNTFLTASVRYGNRNQMTDQDIRTLQTFPNSINSSFRSVDTKDLSGTVDINVDYTKTLKRPQQELSILTLFSRNNRTNDFTARIFDKGFLSGIELDNEINRNNSYNQESTFELNYQSPIKKNQLVEVGGKGILRQVKSDFNFTSQLRPDRIGSLDYDQNVGAAYVSYTLNTKNKYSFKLGTRYEYTDISGVERGDNRLDIPNYHNLVPSVNVSKTLKGGRTLKVAYNRRLQRPGIQFLNPNINDANPQNITRGNPNLRPELTDQFELSTSWFKKSVYLNFSAFARTTNNSIESIRRTLEGGVIETTYDNIGQKQNYGVNIFGNVTLFSKLQLGGGVDTYYAIINNNGTGTSMVGGSNEGMVISGRLFTNLTLKNGWGIQGFGFMRGREVLLQGYQTGFGIYSLGFKKDFNEKRGSFGLSTENFLANTFKMRTELSTPSFTQSSVNALYNRGVRVNFSYKIGKMSFNDQPRRRKGINNDDVKSGGDGGSEGGGAPQQSGPGGGGMMPGGGGGRPR